METRFILDVHLGKLARMLRMTGFDSLYRNDLEDEEIIREAIRENRIVLTRDRGILGDKRVKRGYNDFFHNHVWFIRCLRQNKSE